MATKKIIRRNDLLLFEEVTFYFIYPFVFEPDNWIELENHLKAGIPEERLGWIPTKITKCSFEDQKFIWINPFRPDETGEKKYYDVKLEGIDYSGQLNIISSQISALLRIRRCGVGTITFEINYKKENNNNKLISIYNLDPFFRLTPRTWTNLLYNKISKSDEPNKKYLTTLTSTELQSEQKSLFSLFEFIIANNANTANNANSSSNAKNKFNLMRFFYSDIDDQIPPYGIYDKKEFHDKIKNDLVDNPLEDTVHPYLYFTGQVEKSIYKKNFLEDNKNITPNINRSNNKKYIKQIASILFRLYSLKEIKYLTSDYVIQELNSGNTREFKLFSDNLNSKVYTQIYRMASLCFYYKDINLDYNDLPYEVLHPSIIDILENARSKYASLFYSNLVLDLIIYNLNNISNLADEDLGCLFRALTKTERLIALSLADPNILLYDGHVAFDAVKSVYDKMNISTLSNFVQEKCNLVSGLLSHANDLKYFDILKR